MADEKSSQSLSPVLADTVEKLPWGQISETSIRTGPSLTTLIQPPGPLDSKVAPETTASEFFNDIDRSQTLTIYSITSSARPINAGDISRENAFAVFRLIRSSNLVA